MTITPREGAQPQHRQCASTGRLSAVMFIGHWDGRRSELPAARCWQHLPLRSSPKTRSTYSPYSRPPAPLLLLAA